MDRSLPPRTARRRRDRRRPAGVGGVALLAVLPILVAAGCSVEEGVGTASGVLDVTDCWTGPFDLAPDFFGGQPYRETYAIRVQRGSDFTTFSDGLSFLVDDIHAIRPKNGVSLYGTPIAVGLGPEITAPGIPIVADPNPPLVHGNLSLQTTCRTQNTTLYVLREVSLGPDGACVGASAAPTATRCAATAPPAATGKSTITFASLFNGNPGESNAKERLTDATFDVYLADPREVCPGGNGPPPPCRGHLEGSFRFYFSRSRPAQAFP